MTARLPANQRRRQLLEVAIQVFGAHGYHGASMNDIATAAGVTKPVLYQHFDSKHELFLELLRQVGGDVASVIGEQLRPELEPRAIIEGALGAYFRYFDEHRDAFFLLFGDGVLGDSDFANERHEFERSMAVAISALIDVQGLDRTGRLVLAHGIVGLCESTLRYWLVEDHRLDVGELVDVVGEMLWAGLRGSRPEG